MTTTAQPTPNLNHAAAALIEALDGITDIAGMRTGLAGQITFWSAHAQPGNPNHRDAMDLLTVWRALDDLAASVQARKEARHG